MDHIFLQLPGEQEELIHFQRKHVPVSFVFIAGAVLLTLGYVWIQPAATAEAQLSTTSTKARTFQPALVIPPVGKIVASIPASAKTHRQPEEHAVAIGQFAPRTNSTLESPWWPLAALMASFLAGFSAATWSSRRPAMAMLSTAAGVPEPEIPDIDESMLNFENIGALGKEMDDMDSKAPEPPAQPVEKPSNDETIVGQAENFGFETNTRQILDIVARSLYHDKEVFIRELISNASDAIEKYRYLKLISDHELEEPLEPRVALYCDAENNTFTIQDTGVGMSKEELVNNLGTIASSGSKQLMERLKEAQKKVGDELIGQFGVGFYSAFIVAERVKVFTRSCQKGARGYLWESDGHGKYTITEADGVQQGTKIVVELKADEKDFADEANLEKIAKKYSNFISAPIFLNGKRLNTVEALWRRNPKDVTDEQYTAFYKYVTNAYDKPMYRLHYRVDAPVEVKSVLFIPEFNTEQPGRNRNTPNVSLYCKKVLIKAKCPDLLPEWMRFVSGVVDSEDLPLNVSREGTQDSRAFKKLSKLVTNRVLKWLSDEAEKDKAKYTKFFKEFGYFLKEGSCVDKNNQTAIAKLLRFESSKLEAGELTSFDEYIERFAEGQDRIYFLHSPSRQTALLSPYYEQLRKKGVEVLFMYGQLDEYLMANYPEYKGNKFLSIENSELGLDKIKAKEEADPEDNKDIVGDGLTPKQCKRFSKYLSKVLSDRCSEAKPSDRLVDSPAVISAGFEQASMFRHLKQIANLQGKKGFEGPLGMQSLEYNPRHPIIQRLYWLSRSTDTESSERAKMMAEQVFDNALIAAGMMDDPRLMLKRLNSLLKDSLKDVEVGQEADDATGEAEEEKEEKPEKKGPRTVPDWSPSLDDTIEDIAERELSQLSDEDQKKFSGMVEDTILKNTRPADPDYDLDIQDAEFTAEPPKPKDTRKP